MKKNEIKYKLLALALALSTSLLVACGESQVVEEPTDATNINVVTSELLEIEKDDIYSDWVAESPTYIKLNGADITIDGAGATLNNSTVKISKAGTYVISGKLNDGQIIVDTVDKQTVRLVLNGVDIISSDNAPIYINADKAVISLMEGTDNKISDGKDYELTDPTSDESNSAIFSKGDLTINGTGSLLVNGNYNNGITSRDYLKIIEGTITINSIDDALMGRDMVYIKNGDITINAEGMGIKTTNDAETGKGIVYIDGGLISIVAADDAIHSVNRININSGDISITTGDDGIHADATVNITGGSINIFNSYEGIEGSLINIDAGDISIASSDDGINISGGNDVSETEVTEGGPGVDRFKSSSGESLNISGGNIIVNANGDGLDANGSIYMTGGFVTINGPTSSGNGSLDYDGEFIISGGTLITAGSSGMAQMPSDTSTQNTIMISFTATQKLGSNVQLQDSSGKTIITLVPDVDYQALLMSSSDLKLDESYTLVIDDASIVKFTLSKVNLRISETGEEVTGGGMNRGGMKGGIPGEGQGGIPGIRTDKGAIKP